MTDEPNCIVWRAWSVDTVRGMRHFAATDGNRVGLVFLIALFSAAGCEPAYDVTAQMSGGAIRFTGLPTRPAPPEAANAAVNVAGARIIAATDDTAALIFTDGAWVPLITSSAVAPFPPVLREPPSDDRLVAQVLAGQAFLSQLVRPLPQVLEEQMGSKDAAVRQRSVSLAGALIGRSHIGISGTLGRWWRFSGYYVLMPADRERLAATIGAGRERPESLP